MLHDPMTGKGFISWAFLGFGGAILALLVAYIVPGVIPAKAAATRL